jgi:hypothetical protein
MMSILVTFVCSMRHSCTDSKWHSNSSEDEQSGTVSVPCTQSFTSVYLLVAATSRGAVMAEWVPEHV